MRARRPARKAIAIHRCGEAERLRSLPGACSKRKTPAGTPPGLAFATSISRSGSWIEVILDAQDARPDVGVCDRHCARSRTSRGSRSADERSARERRFGSSVLSMSHFNPPVACRFTYDVCSGLGRLQARLRFTHHACAMLPYCRSLCQKYHRHTVSKMSSKPRDPTNAAARSESSCQGAGQ
jgi:hypothetical protein